jgi:hypothetical protein
MSTPRLDRFEALLKSGAFDDLDGVDRRTPDQIADSIAEHAGTKNPETVTPEQMKAVRGLNPEDMTAAELALLIHDNG